MKAFLKRFVSLRCAHLADSFARFTLRSAPLVLLFCGGLAHAQFRLTPSFQQLKCGTATYGNNAAATGTQTFTAAQSICAFTMPYGGRLYQMTISNNSLNGGSCTTAPTFEAYIGGSVQAPTQTASASAQALGTVTTVTYSTAATPSPAFTAGQIVGVEISTVGGTCVLPEFSVSLSVQVP